MENLFFIRMARDLLGMDCRFSVMGSRLWVLGYRATNDNEKVSIHIIVGADELGMAGGGSRCGDGDRTISATFLQARKQT